jgi:hypothetical protein
MKWFVYISLLLTLSLQQVTCWTSDDPSFLLGILGWPIVLIFALIIEAVVFGIILQSGHDGSVQDGNVMGAFDRQRQKISWMFYILAMLLPRIEMSLLFLGAVVVFRLARAEGSRVVVPALLSTVLVYLGAMMFRVRPAWDTWAGWAYAVLATVLIAHSVWIWRSTKHIEVLRSKFQAVVPRSRSDGDTR